MQVQAQQVAHLQPQPPQPQVQAQPQQFPERPAGMVVAQLAPIQQHMTPMPPPAAEPVAARASTPSDSMGLTAPMGPQVLSKQYAAPGTSLHSFIAYGAASIATLIMVIFTAGVGLLLLAMTPVLEWLFRRRIHARILGSSVRVSPDQLPEIYQSASVIAQRMGLRQLPEVFVLESNSINAVAARIAGRKLVILTDDMVDACLRSGDVNTLNFVLAHELAHHAMGHTGFIRSYLSQVYAPLARVDELSADRLATAVLGQPETAASAIITLVTGPQLLRYVNREALMRQAFEIAKSKVAKRAERPLRHPLLLRRLAQVYSQ
jgi:Zn-dependent protease with chaperone function